VDKKDYEDLTKKSDHELYDFITENDSSQRKWVAVHLLELRRNQELTKAAKASAVAAWLAALVAGCALVFSILK
jgi:hypothetical protein